MEAKKLEVSITELKEIEGTKKKVSNAERKMSDALFEISVKLEKAMLVLNTLINYYNFDETELTDTQKQYIGYSVGNICNLLYIVSDYMHGSQQLTEECQ